MQEIVIDNAAAKKYTRKVFIAFIIFIILIASAVTAWRWLYYHQKDGGFEGDPAREVAADF